MKWKMKGGRNKLGAEGQNCFFHTEADAIVRDFPDGDTVDDP
jgi:hypothetical protein